MSKPAHMPRSEPALPALVVVVSALLAAVANADAHSARVDALFARWDRPDSPGCALGVIRDGDWLYKRGSGMANLEHGVPISSRTVFRIGSLSKQFTAMAILLLELRGLRPRDAATRAEAYELVTRQRSLNDVPGERYVSSDTGYFLFSIIVQRASGLSLREFAETYMFEPLGMRDTHFHDERSAIRGVFLRYRHYIRSLFFVRLTDPSCSGESAVSGSKIE